MEETLLTAGEFAKLARTTKRTVLWYAEKGILAPHRIDSSGYRFYRPKQIIDFQGLLLMRKLGLSIADIQVHVERGESLRHLFKARRGLIEQSIADLKRTLADTKRYYVNLAVTGTLVKPILKQQESFEVFYLYKKGPYANIKDHIVELRSMFSFLPKDAVFLTIFIDRGYNPKNAKMKVGVLKQPNIKPKVGVAILRQVVPSYKVLCYSHYGPATLLSLLWQELEKYRVNERLALNTGLPFADLEFYITGDKTSKTPYTELHMPIKQNG